MVLSGGKRRGKGVQAHLLELVHLTAMVGVLSMVLGFAFHIPIMVGS